MEPIDVDEVMDVNFPDASSDDASSDKDAQCVEVTFKDGSKKTFSGLELADAMTILNHWTPPTA